MRPIDRVDPELRQLARAAAPPRLSLEKLASFREIVDSTYDFGGVAVAGVGRSERWISAADGHRIRVIIYNVTSGAVDRPAILHLHGGGYICGTPEMQDARNASLATELGCMVVSVAYRLAPETPAPGNAQDCAGALEWLRRECSSLGIDPQNIVILGESAGGGLAAALALMFRDRAMLGPAGIFLISPMLDDRTGSIVPVAAHRGHFDWDAAANRFGWAALLGDKFGTDDVPAWAAPARAVDLSHMPPSFIAVGELDLFLDENIDFAQRLGRAGTPVELHVYPGAFHGFEADCDAGVSKALRQDLVNALRRCFTASEREYAGSCPPAPPTD